jgi:dTDP-4-amino-4,6-dideoxygalactose transaminase
MATPGIPLFDLVISEDDLSAVEAALRAGGTTAGDRTAEFERAFAEHLGVRHAVAVSSCTAALHLAYAAVGVGPGDEVIVPTITFAATAAAAVYLGADPVFADVVGDGDLGLDPVHVEKLITTRTRAVCAMHYGGYACAVDELRELCDRAGITLVEDSAHAPSASRHGRALGTFGTAGCFSFFSNKVLSVGEGGLVATDDDAVAEAVRAGREHEYRFDDWRAALLLSRMGRLEAEIRRRRELTHRYRELLAGRSDVVLPYGDEDVDTSSCYVMPILLTDPDRQGPVRERMRERHGVQTSLLYPAVHEFTAYVQRFGRADLPRAESAARRQVTLPLFGSMTDEQQDRVVDALTEALDSGVPAA